MERERTGGWQVVATDIPTITEPHPDKPGWKLCRPGKPRAYAVVDANWKERARFPTEAEADAEAARLNAEELERTFDQDPVLVQRRRHFRELGEAPEEHPGRYAVRMWSDWNESYWTTCETLADVEKEVRTADVQRVVGLDTGTGVQFSVSVAFEDEPS
jgi:hypothetical protein